MGQSDRFDPDATPPFGERGPGEPEPLYIREATEPPVEQTATLPRMPAAPVEPIAPVTRVLPDPRLVEPRYVPVERPREAWPFVLAILALLLGGLGGFLLASALDDDDETIRTAEPPTSTAPANAEINATLDQLLVRTRENGEYRTPSEYPQLDEITAIDSAAATAVLESQLAALTTAEGDAAGAAAQIVELETQLAEMTAARDDLQRQVEQSGDTGSEAQTQLDAANARITALETELATARSSLDTANADVRTARAELDAANAQLTQLNVKQLPNYANGDVAKARSDASTNGWTLIEETVTSSAVAGTVVEQAPAPNANMVRGSVLIVRVAGE